MPSFAVPAGPGAAVPTVFVATANLAQAAATYDLCTASGNVLVHDVTPYVSVAAVGLTSATIQTNNTTPVVILASVLLAVITIDKTLTPYVGPTYLPSGKKIQYTIVGTGSAGSVVCVVRFTPLTSTATLV